MSSEFCLGVMTLGKRLSREEKGKFLADAPEREGEDPGSGSPLDEFSLLHRDALRDTINMTLDQRLLVAESHGQFREEEDTPVIARGGEDPRNDNPSEPAPPRENAPRRGKRKLVQSRIPRLWRPELQSCRPTCYHHGGLFEELPALPPEDLRDPYADRQD